MTVDRWSAKIDDITSRFKREFSNLSPKRLNWKPNAQTWSVAQNMDHLIVINESYYPVLKEVRSNTHQLPWFARFGFVVNFIGGAILKAVHPDRRRKTKTFSIWEPSATDLGADILVRFEKHQEDLKKFIASNLDLVEVGTVIASPANRKIIYRLDTAFDIMVTHEERHFEQAKEALLLKPGS